MANKIQIKRSSTSSDTPSTSDLDYGELAINYADGKLYNKNSSDAIAEIGGSGEMNVQSDWNVSDSSADDFIENKPTVTNWSGGSTGLNASTGRTSLGLVIGTNVQAYDAQLADVAGLAVTNGNFIVGDGSNFVAESGNTARTSLGLGTGDSPTFTDLTTSGALNITGGTGGAHKINLHSNNYMYVYGGSAGLALGDDGFDRSIYIPNEGTIGIYGNTEIETDTYPQLTIDGTDNSGHVGIYLEGGGARGAWRWNSSNNDIEFVAENGSVTLSLLDSSNDATFAGAINVGGSIIPTSDDAVDLGSSSKKFRSLYVGDDTIHLGDTTISGSSYNSSNWDTAYSDRLKWDGSSSGLTASTGRSSLGLGDLATKSLSSDMTFTGDIIFHGDGSAPNDAVVYIKKDSDADWCLIADSDAGGSNAQGIKIVQGWSSTTKAFTIWNNNSGTLTETFYVTPVGTVTWAGGGSVNANTAYSERRQWDGDSNNLNAENGRTSLGLGNLAVLSTVNATHIDADAVDSSEIASNAVDADHLNVSGNGSSSQYLRSDGDGSFTWATPTDTNTQLSSEQVQDIVGAMFSGNTETRITATYQDGDGTIDLVVDDLDTDTNTWRGITAGGNTLGSSEALTLSAGSNVSISESGGTVTIASTDTNTTYSNSSWTITSLSGFNSSTSNYLRGDGSWVTPPNDNTTYSVGDGGLTQNNFTNALKSKLDGIESGATADQDISGKANLSGADFTGNITTDGYLEFDGTHDQQLYTGTHSLVVKNMGTAGSGGILQLASGGAFCYQLYGDGTSYGFLDGAWAHWDFKKVRNGKLYMNDNETYYIQTDGASYFGSTITVNSQGNSSQWNTAYSERRQWDGSSSNLNADTAKNSLALNTGNGVQFARVACGVADDANYALKVSGNIYTSGSNAYFQYTNFYGAYLGSNWRKTLVGGDHSDIASSNGAICSNEWFRTYGNGGHYWNDHDMHLYSSADNKVIISAGGSNNVEFELWTTGGNKRGSFYADNSNHVGILDAGGSWAYRVQNDDTHYWCTNDNTTRMTLTTSGTLTATGDVVAYSDGRLKENINTIDSALDKVVKMRGVTYDRTDVEKFGTGVVAQELEEIAPELVNNENEYKAVSYNGLNAYLIEAIKELKAEIEELKDGTPK